MSQRESEIKLRALVDEAFPLNSMPPQGRLVLHDIGCEDCCELTRDLEGLRESCNQSEIVQNLYQQVYSMSGETFDWYLSRALRFELDSTSDFGSSETEFLIYSFSSEQECKVDCERRLSRISKEKKSCLISFFTWLLENEYWRDLFCEEIRAAIGRLK